MMETKEVRIQIKKLCPKCKQGMVLTRLENLDQKILERMLLCLNCGYKEPVTIDIKL